MDNKHRKPFFIISGKIKISNLNIMTILIVPVLINKAFSQY